MQRTQFVWSDRLTRLTVFASALLLSACASSVTQQPAATPTISSTALRAIRVLETTDIKLPTAYIRTLKAGTQWTYAGTLPQGDIYRPINTVFTIEGRNVHEAYLVIHKNNLVGFYLPGERGYSPLSHAIPLHLGE